MKMSMDIKYSGNEAVDAMETITITGNITPKRWYKTILRENGKPYRLAIDILADIVYWHRPDVIQDDNGIVVEIQKRFKNNYLQRSYKEYANLYGESKRTVKAALDRLVDIGVIKRFFRNVTLDNDMVLYNVMFITLNVRRLLELTYTEEDLKKYDLLVQKHASYTTEPVNSKKRTTPYKKCQQGVQKNVPSPAKKCKTNTKNTTENTDRDYPIFLYSEHVNMHLSVIDDRSDKMDVEKPKPEQYRELIYENTHLEYHLENDPPEDREEYENLVELICDVVCAEHNEPLSINSSRIKPELVRSRLLKITDSHIRYVMECLRNSPNRKGIRSHRNYMLTCLYNAPVTLDTYYQQRANHDMYR